MSTNIPIVFSTDNNYIMPTGVAILSLLKSAKPTTVYEIFVLINDDVTEDNKILLRKQVAYFPNHTIEFVNVGKVFENSFEIRDISVATYSRLLIPWLIPQYDKIIFSDVDVIFRIDLAEVYNDNLSGYFVAAVPSVAAVLNQTHRKYIKDFNLNPDEYYNAGFLIINCKLQRAHDLKQRILEEAKKKYTYQDQDVINIICKDKIKRISPKYCITPNFYRLITEDRNVLYQFYGDSNQILKYMTGNDCILHYAGPKPWNTFTYAWIDWWLGYKESIFYNVYFETEISYKILHPNYSWRNIISLIKNKFFNG